MTLRIFKDTETFAFILMMQHSTCSIMVGFYKQRAIFERKFSFLSLVCVLLSFVVVQIDQRFLII